MGTLTPRCAAALVVTWVGVVTGVGGGVFAAPGKGAAPSREVGDVARRQAHAMYEAFRKGRLDEFVSYTYPVVVKQMGGKEKMIALLDKGRADMEKQGFRFVSGSVASPVQIVKAGSQIHALLPLTQILAAPGGQLHMTGHLLGISSDGQSWTFIDSGSLTPDDVREVLPNFNPELRLPPKSEPRFVPK